MTIKVVPYDKIYTGHVAIYLSKEESIDGRYKLQLCNTNVLAQNYFHKLQRLVPIFLLPDYTQLLPSSYGPMAIHIRSRSLQTHASKIDKKHIETPQKIIYSSQNHIKYSQMACLLKRWSAFPAHQSSCKPRPIRNQNRTLREPSHTINAKKTQTSGTNLPNQPGGTT